MATAKKVTTASKIRGLLTINPSAKVADIAKKMNVSPAYVYQVKSKMGTPKTPKQQWKIVHMSTSKEAIKEKQKPIQLGNIEPLGQQFLNATKSVNMDAATPQADNVNHPAHYKVGGIETIDFLEAKLTPEEFRGYLRGNVLKYLSRAGNKGNYEEDMLKARWYLNRETAKFGK